MSETKTIAMESVTLEGLPATAALEISIVECLPEKSGRYHELRSKMMPLMQKQPGFIAWRAFESSSREGVMLDVLYWEKAEYCQKAMESLHSEEIAQEFFQLISKTVVFDMFRRQKL